MLFMHTHALIISKHFKYVKDIYVPKLGICGNKLQLTNSGLCNGIAHSFLFLPALSSSWIGTVKKYLHVMKVASFYSIVGTTQCLIFSLVMERDLSAWKIQPNFNLFLIIATGIFRNLIRTSVHVKCTQMKGPYYVPLFKPFGIFWATLFGTSFFVNSLHYGSVLGAAIGGVGYITQCLGDN